MSVTWSQPADGLNRADSPVDQPESSRNAPKPPAADLSLDEWSVNWKEPAKRTKRRHEPRVIDLPSAVVDEVHRVDAASDVVGSPIAISKPYFEAAWPRNVSAILGQSAVLKCRTRLLGERMVNLIFHIIFSYVYQASKKDTIRLSHLT